MAAGQTYDKYLNTIRGNKQTPFLYDATVDEWMAPVQNYVYTGALWVPQAATEDGAVLIGGKSLRQTQVGSDQQIAWANSAAANTQQTIMITKPSAPVDEYELIVYNPSTVTDLTIKIFAIEPALGGGARDALITITSILKAQIITNTTMNTYTRILHGIFNGADVKLIVSNDTALGAAGGFTAYVRLREVL